MEDIIYLETDAEITEAIDKLKSAKGEHIKIVVPQRSGLLQSVVNLKLLKKEADNSHKQLALITSDKTAQFLAARIGLAIAPNLKTEPKIPEVAEEVTPEPDIVAQPETDATEPAEDFAAKDVSAESTDQPADTPLISKKSITEPSEESRPPKKKGKVPDYNRFQKKLFIGIAAALGLVAIIVLLFTLPTAKVIITAKADKKPVDSRFSLDASTSSSDFDNTKVTAKKIETTKDLNASFTATGKKDVGTKATGNLTIKNCEDSNSRALPAGTKMTSGDKNFTTDSAVTIPAGSFSGGGTVCNSPTVLVSATAVENGDSYNLSNAAFSSPALTANFRINGTTGGGTSKQVTVVTQGDIDKAKKDMIDSAGLKAKDELTDKVPKASKAFPETFANEILSFKSSADPDSENTNGTITAKVKYSLLSATSDDLSKLIAHLIGKDISNNLEVYKNGADDAKYKVLKLTDPNTADVNVVTNAFVGSKIDKAKLSSELTNKSKKDVADIVKKEVNATNVQVNSVALVPNMPPFASKIIIEVQVNAQ